MKFPGFSRLIAIGLSRFYYPYRFGFFGSRSVLESPLLLSNSNFISIGSKTSIRRGVRLEALSNDKDDIKIIIGSGCLIEQNVQIIARRKVVIGSNVSIAGNCAIVDVTHPYNLDGHPNIGYRIFEGIDEVFIDDGCFIGFGSVVLPGVTLGKGCVVGANSVVTRSFGPKKVIAGSPAVVIKSY